jgi:uncharacterized protein (DUF1778 family)
MATAESVMQFRLKNEEKERIKQSADLTGVKASQFVLRAALIEAQHVLADRTQFTLDDDRYDAFLDALSESPESNDALNKLLRTSAHWD